MAVFVDTSALYALLDQTEQSHAAAARTLPDLLTHEQLLTHNYVVVETVAVVHRRLGAAAVRDLLNDLVAALDVLWVDRDVHDRAVAAYLAGGRRRVSLVDRVSFELMRRNGVEAAFAFDRDFAAEGFRLIP